MTIKHGLDFRHIWGKNPMWCLQWPAWEDNRGNRGSGQEKLSQTSKLVAATWISITCLVSHYAYRKSIASFSSIHVAVHLLLISLFQFSTCQTSYFLRTHHSRRIQRHMKLGEEQEQGFIKGCLPLQQKQHKVRRRWRRSEEGLGPRKKTLCSSNTSPNMARADGTPSLAAQVPRTDLQRCMFLVVFFLEST